MIQDIKQLLIGCELAVAGLIGAFVATPFQSNLKTKQSMIVFVISGAACAHYLTDLVVYKLAIEEASIGGAAFLLGAFGGSLIAKIVAVIQDVDLVGMIRSKIGGGSE